MPRFDCEVTMRVEVTARIEVTARGEEARELIRVYLIAYCGPMAGDAPARIMLGDVFDTIVAQLYQALRHYPNNDGQVRFDSVKPVPRPDYELEYGGPYKWIVNVRYNKDWGAGFGVRTDNQIVLWMD